MFSQAVTRLGSEGVKAPATKQTTRVNSPKNMRKRSSSIVGDRWCPRNNILRCSNKAGGYLWIENSHCLIEVVSLRKRVVVKFKLYRCNNRGSNHDGLYTPSLPSGVGRMHVAASPHVGHGVQTKNHQEERPIRLHQHGNLLTSSQGP